MLENKLKEPPPEGNGGAKKNKRSENHHLETPYSDEKLSQTEEFKDRVELIAMEWKPGRAGSMFTIGVTRGNRLALLEGLPKATNQTALRRSPLLGLRLDPAMPKGPFDLGTLKVVSEQLLTPCHQCRVRN